MGKRKAAKEAANRKIWYYVQELIARLAVVSGTTFQLFFILRTFPLLSTMIISCLTTSQNVTAPKRTSAFPLWIRGLTTSQNVTAPKLAPSNASQPSSLTTSQNVTAPKRRGPPGRGPLGLTTSQNVTAPKRHGAFALMSRSFDYQSECHCSKTVNPVITGSTEFDYQSECHCSKTNLKILLAAIWFDYQSECHCSKTHGAYSNTKVQPGDWRDEFRASYRAALDTPNLSDEERRMLMIDAYERASEVGAKLNYTKDYRRIVHGYEEQ